MYFENTGFRIFSVAGIDVSVSFWYALLMGFIVFTNPGVGGLLFALAITVSILIHEFGHALPSKVYGLQPSILLHGFGGLCMHQPADSDWKDILIIVAGPLVQIVVGIAAFAALYALPGEPGQTMNWELLLYYFAWVSVIWGGINLVLPIYPLDGGQLFHMILRRFMVEHRAQDLALKTSIAVAVPAGIYGLVSGWFFAAFLVLFIVMGNVQTLQSGARLVDRKAKVRATDFVRDTLRAAEKAYADEDWREAARLCHMLRAAKDPVPPRDMERLWEILAVATVNQGEWDEAPGWLKRAPDTPAVRQARARLEQHLAEGAPGA